MRGLHRIRVESSGDSPVADRLREYLHRSGYVLVADSSYSLKLTFETGEALALDSVDSPMEARILANLQELDCPHVLLKRKGGNQDPQAAVITVPPAQGEAVARAVFRAIEQVANQVMEPERPIVSAPPSKWWRFWLLVLLIPALANAQTNRVTFGGVAQPVTCSSGCSNPTDTDDGSIAGSQTVGLGSALAHVWNSTAWVRLTLGQATMANSIPVAIASNQGALSTSAAQSGTWTVQPGNTANTTAWLVTGTGGTFPVTATNLDVQIGGSDTVTVTATNLDVQSAGTDLATSAQGSAIQTAVEALNTANATDPCRDEAKTYYRVDIVTATTVEIANAVASEFWYICAVNLVTAGANNVLIAEDDTDGCGSLSAGISSGGTTAAEGWNFAANGGIAHGDGTGTIMKSTTANRYFCIITSAAVQLSGVIAYVSDP